ncbi:MAG: arginine--tRNA ligase [Methanomicrobiales archaeon]|jgi:arginyl-tRNA synthetase|nr:arginine--tRNA ligase [Methanomicrobiales archaeon]
MYSTTYNFISSLLCKVTGRDNALLTDGGEHADLASTIAFAIAKEEKRNPAEVATELVEKIREELEAEIDCTITTLGPYINFVFGSSYCARAVELAQVLGYGTGVVSKDPQQVSICLEHTSANPNGPLHVGHIRNTILGDTLARCFRKAGYPVEVQFYVNDMGRQIAIVSWGIEWQKQDMSHASKKGDHLVADVYIQANRDLEAEPAHATEIEKLMQGVEAGDPEVLRRFRVPVMRCLNGFKETLARLDVQHDRFIFESDFVKNGDTERLLARIARLPIAKHEETLSLDLSEYGFEKEYVLRRSDGTSVYAARDLAYHRWKAHNFSRVIDVLGADHKLIGKQLQATLEVLGEKPPAILFFEFVSLPEGSMSTRRGKFISADELLDEVLERAKAEVAARRPDLSDSERDAIARSVSVSAIRYDIVKTIPEKSTVFNWKEALDFEKQSGPYIQYAHARACSMLQKAREAGWAGESAVSSSLVYETPYEIALVKHIAKFPSIIQQVVSDSRPHLLAIYARELADLFNSFYHAEPVLKSEGITRESRLALVAATQNTLQEALLTLGIDPLSAM